MGPPKVATHGTVPRGVDLHHNSRGGPCKKSGFQKSLYTAASLGQEVVIATPSGPKVVRRVSDDSEDDEDEEKATALGALAEAQEVAAEAEAALAEQDEEYGGALHV